jgi:hypothetical protein
MPVLKESNDKSWMAFTEKDNPNTLEAIQFLVKP